MILNPSSEDKPLKGKSSKVKTRREQDISLKKPFVQSFARRKCRAHTAEQQKLMDELYPKLRIKPDFSNLEDLTKGLDKINLEIGFGAGEHLLNQAAKNPGNLYIGAEVFLNGVASCLQEMDNRGIKNVRFYDEDSRILLKKLPKDSIYIIYILFADPWPKKRHNKRRIINNETLGLLYNIIKKSGFVRIATDHAEYFEWMLEVCKGQSLFSFEVIDQPVDHVVTRYQQKGLNEGRPSQFLHLYKN